MLISFGRKDKRVRGLITGLSVPPTPGLAAPGQRQTRLVDLRNATAFSSGFAPGSYSVPDAECLAAAGDIGLFEDRSVYLLADKAEQLEMCADSDSFGPTASLEGWFSPDALDEWQMLYTDLGFIERIRPETLAIRTAAWNTLAIKVHHNGRDVAGAPADSLTIALSDLRKSLDGLPTETSLCVICSTTELGSFAASLFWNFGFHRSAYLVQP